MAHKYDSLPEVKYSDTHAALHAIDLRLRGLRINNPGNPEIARIEAARAEVTSRMTAEEIKAYDERHDVKKTPQQLAKEAQDLEKAMAENRDRPSI